MQEELNRKIKNAKIAHKIKGEKRELNLIENKKREKIIN